MAATDCLLNCLREVQLERFHRNFTERGLINCEQLSSLLVDDYSRFGVVSTDDRRRLFQLIHIIKSVQADGIYCQHGVPAFTTSQSNGIQQRTKPSSSVPNSVRQKEQLPDVTRNGVVLAQKIVHARDDRAKKCPAAPGRQFIKPISSDCNYRVQYEQPVEKARLHITEETKVVAKNPEAAIDDSSGTPKFNCRKTLTFSDSDLYSDGSDSNHFHQLAVSSTPAKSLPRSCSSSSVTLSSPAAKLSNLRPPQVIATTCISSPRAFVIPADNKPITRHRSNSQTESQTSGSDRQPTHVVIQNGLPRNKSSFRNDDSQRHAYFPAAKIPPQEEPETHIEQIYHSNGYNYGVPGSANHFVDKVLFFLSLIVSQYFILKQFYCVLYYRISNFFVLCYFINPIFL